MAIVARIDRQIDAVLRHEYGINRHIKIAFMNVDLSMPLVPVRYARGLLSVAEARGLPRARLMRRARLDEVELGERRARISVKQFSMLYGDIALGLRDETCGLRAQAMPLGGIEMLCRAALSTSTLRSCLPVMARCLSVAMPNQQAEFQPATATHPARLQLVETLPPPGDAALAHELGLFTLCGILAWLFGRRLPLLAVALPFARPRHAAGLRLLLAAPLQFDAPATRLDFAEDSLALPIVRTAEEISRLMRRAPASLIEGLVAQAELPTRLIALLQQAMPRPLTLEAAAARLAMSPRTLHRKLAAQGESFQSIKDAWRLRQAQQWLSCTDKPVKEIAADLGFSDQATFRRAFAQWTGQPPGALRRAARQSSGAGASAGQQAGRT